ncbi:peptidoglycan bridge formation glycyltransferase FemA/FemB family protein [Ktedonobacteria bacterium brp13]|nr:peptidoglycan bridge formation glycyltransferase FemA/FemB family protein [Ktedonobacteria bacterium brp13]
MQSWEWGELKASAGWSPLRLALWDGTKIVAGAQVLCKTAPHVPLWLGHLAYMPRGPVLDWSQADLCTLFFRELHRYLRKRGALALRIEPDVEDGTTQSAVLLQRLQASGIRGIHQVHAVQPLRTIMLALTPSEEELMAQMKEKWRYNVRLGLRKGVSVRAASSLADVSAWYDLLQTTGERDSFGIHTLAYYEQVWQLYAPSGRLRLLLAEYEGQLLAGIFVGLMAGQAIYLYGASSNEQRKLMPNYVLQWEAIRWAREHGAQSYDFWGIPDTDAEDEAMAGVYRFKRGWGGRVVRYVGNYEIPYHSLLMSVARRFL